MLNLLHGKLDLQVSQLKRGWRLFNDSAGLAQGPTGPHLSVRGDHLGGRHETSAPPQPVTPSHFSQQCLCSCLGARLPARLRLGRHRPLQLVRQPRILTREIGNILESSLL